jgi:group I intron endonuclease
MIYKALLKNGYSSFSLYILEYCDSKDLINREQYYLDSLKPEYNILKTAGSLLGFKHSEDPLAKISEAKKGKILASRASREETRAKMSSGKKGQPRPEGAGSPSQKIEVLDFLTNEKKIYDSMGAAALDLGIKKIYNFFIYSSKPKKCI